MGDIVLQNIKLKLYRVKYHSIQADSGENYNIFHMINHQILLAKMKNFLICGDALRLLASYFEYRIQVVRIGDVFSNERINVPQENILSPVLYSVYTEDFPRCVSYGLDTYFTGMARTATTAIQKTVTSWFLN